MNTSTNKRTMSRRETFSSHHHDIDTGTMELNDRSSRSGRQNTHYSSQSSFASVRTNSSESLVSFFGSAVPTPVTSTRTARRIRQRTLSSASLSSIPNASRRWWCWLKNTPSLVQCMLLAAAFILLEQWAVLNSWLATDYYSDPESVAASLSASVSEFTATASLSVSSTSASNLYTQSSSQPAVANPGLHIVVSHCDKPLDWLWQRVVQTGRQLQQKGSDSAAAAAALRNIKSVTIFSKCGQEASLEKSLPPIANIVTLPNVGRCDHSYAYWIAHALQHLQEQPQETVVPPTLFHPADPIWFVKDNDNSYRSKVEIVVPLEQMLRSVTQHSDFMCASHVSPRLGEEMGYRGVKALNVAVQKNIGRFQMYSVYSRDNYTVFGDEGHEEASATAKNNNKDAALDPFFPPNPNVTVVEEWVDSLPIYNLTLGNKGRRSSSYLVWDALQQKPVDITPPSNHLNAFMPICFGGVFMTTFDRLKYAPVGDWGAVVKSLGRGDNIEEGHFMERLWAALLSEPMSQDEQQLIQNSNFKVVKKAGAYKGLVLLEEHSIEHDVFDPAEDVAIRPATWWSRVMSKLGLGPASSVNGQSDKPSPLLDAPAVGIHVVVSHCAKPLDWIWDRLLLMTDNINMPPEFPVKSITVLTKCGYAPGRNQLPRLPRSSVFAKNGIDPVRIIELPNVGRSHHSYAYWIAHHLMEEQANTGLYFPMDSVVFVQDTDNIVYHRQFGYSRNKAKFRKLYDQSVKLGFFCGETPTASTLLAAPGSSPSQSELDEMDQNNFVLNIASKSNMGNFKPSDTKSMQEWVDKDTASIWNVTMAVTPAEVEAVNAAVQSLKDEDAQAAIVRPLTQERPIFMPVCLGGHFMATLDRILSAPVNDWKQAVAALGDDNGDSTRFMERLWAVLLSPPMEEEDQKALLRQEYNIFKRNGRYKGLVSIMKKSEPPVPEARKKGWKNKREPFMKQWMDQKDILLKKYW